jgi:predicted DNA-binding protein
VVKEVQVPQPALVVPKELTDRLTALEERTSKFEANIERVVEAMVKAIEG